MKTEIENALKVLIAKASHTGEKYSASEVLHFTQAALNLSQAFSVFSEAIKTTELQ